MSRLHFILLLFIGTAVWAQQPDTPDVLEAAVRRQATIVELLNKGNAAFGGELFEQAERYYRQYWQKAYNQDLLVDASERLVKTLIHLERPEDAVDLLDEVEKSRKLTKAHRITVDFWRGRLLIMLNQPTAALPLFVRLSHSKPPAELLPEIYMGAAECYVAAEQWQNAVVALKNAETVAPNTAMMREARLGLVRAHLEMKDYQKAEVIIAADFADAERPYRNKLGMYRIEALLGLGRVEEAYNFYRNMMISSPTYSVDGEDFQLLRALGLAVADGNDPAGAAQDIFEKNLVFYTNREDRQQLLCDAAEAWALAGDYSTAISRLRTFLDNYSDHPNEVHVRYRIAELWDEMDEPVEAVTAFTLVYNRQDAPVELRYQAVRRVSALYTADGDLELAAKALLAASQLEVGNERRADALYFAAETWFKLQDYDEAAHRYGEIVKSFGDTGVAESAHFKQAQAHYFRKLYRKAAEAFKDFLVSWPNASPERLATATLQLGLAQSEARDQYTQAAETLANFAIDWPEHERTSYALLVAAHAYLQHDRPVPAMTQLTKIMENFKDTKEYPYAIYWRSYLLLANGQPEQAEADGVKFVIEHGESHPELAAEVLLWLGHEVSDAEPAVAQNYFLQLVKDFSDSRYAPEALYRAAENAYNQGRHANAIAYIEQLLADYPEGPDRVKAKSWYLRGDIESTSNRFKEAGEAYGTCAVLAKGSRLYFAAIGSRGDAYYSLAGLEGDGSDSYEEARKSYELIVAECKDESFVEMSRYRAAKIHEILARQQTDPEKREEHIDLASQYYFDIFFFYKTIDISANLVDWYYFSRAGFDLARLYVEDGRLEAAVTIYDLVGSARIPTAPDARKRAADLRRLQLE